MRLNKILAVTSLTAILSVGAFAQFYIYDADDNWGPDTKFEGVSGIVDYDFGIRVMIPADSPRSPRNGGASFGIQYNPRYFDIILTDDDGNEVSVNQRAAEANVGQIVSLPGAPGRTIAGVELRGATTVGVQRQADGTLRFKAAVLATAPTLAATNANHIEYLIFNALGELPKLRVNWDNLAADFGVGGSYAPSNDGSFVFELTTESGAFSYRSRPQPINGLMFNVVPEPASMIALGSGLVGLLALRRRRAN